MKQVVTTCLALLLISMCAETAFAQNADAQREQQLTREREKLERERDPVDRAKIGIKICEILLEEVGDSVRDGDYGQMEQELAAYTETVQNAHQGLVDSGRNAQKNPGGFKELEIALRKHAMKFDDYARMVTVDRREPITKVKDLAIGVRNRLLKAIFP